MLLYILEAVFACIGAVWLLLHVYSLAKLLYTTLLRAPIDLKKQYGQWAVVTGCTDGIGKAMAIELARRGHSIFLIGRSEDKLKALQAEMPTGAETRSHIIDFATGFGAKEATKIRSALEGLDVGVLVNNVGVSYSFPQWFHELTDDELHTLVAVNIDSVNWMTRAVLPLMLKRSKGCVVNVASAASRAPSPLLAAYGATKNYVESLTASLSIEYADKGITFQSHAPLWVATSMVFPKTSARSPEPEQRATRFTPTAKAYAATAVDRIGLPGTDALASPWWAHELVMWLSSSLPRGTAFTDSKMLFGMHKQMRFHPFNVERMKKKGAATELV